MKSLTLASAVALIASAGAAFGADLSTGSLKDGSIPVTASGPYLSVGVGAAVNDGGTQGAAFGFAGFLTDVRAGYDMRAGNWVAGPFAEVSWEAVRGYSDLTTVAAANGTTATIGYAFGGRLGHMLSSDTMVYALLAYQGQHVGINNTGFSSDLSGVRAGAGFEIDLKNGWGLAAESSWIGYGKWTPAAGMSVSDDEVRTSARLIWHLH